jgi:branched-chain amino acid aminotransferase
MMLSPAALSLHYGQEIFEGLKAYRQPDGSVALFRPDANATRFDLSADRLAMPRLPDGMFTSSCIELVRRDEAFVPSVFGQSLYLRPIMIASEAGLGVRPANEYLYAVIASPAGSYFPGGIRPLTVWTTEHYVRAVAGGTGAAKCAGNYAASLAAKAEATSKGCDEALWLDALERRWIEELSGMNVIFVAAGDERAVLVTPPAVGTILDGITRKSVLLLARDLGFEVVERPIAIDEVYDGAFDEAFACGTAAVIAPIGAIQSSRGEARFGSDGVGPVALELRDALLALQEGRAADPHGWRVPVAR